MCHTVQGHEEATAIEMLPEKPYVLESYVTPFSSFTNLIRLLIFTITPNNFLRLSSDH